MPHDRRGVRISAQSSSIAVCQDGYHRVVKIVDGVVQNRLKTTIIFFSCLVKIIPELDANFLIFTRLADILGLQHLDVLHGHFGHALGATMKLLKVDG